MTEDQKVSAELARDAAHAIATLVGRDPDFANDDGAWVAYEDALTSLASACYGTTHSGIGLVSGELLAAALPALAMRQWDAAAELARTGAAYAEVEVAHIEQGGGMYDYAKVPYTLAAISPIRWDDDTEDLATDALTNLVTLASSIAAAAREHWQATLRVPVKEWPDDPDQATMLNQLSEVCSTLDVAGNFADANRPPLLTLLHATVRSLACWSWSTTYPFAAATAVLAGYELHHRGRQLAPTPERVNPHAKGFTPEESARRRAIVMAMLEERDRLGSMSLEEVSRARDEGRAQVTTVYDASVVAAWRLRDEANNAAATTVAMQLADERGIVPGNFWYEIRNVLIRAERQGRIHEDATDRFIERLGALVESDGNHNEAVALQLARLHGLSFYDAAYLETALRRQADLATFDRALAAAVRAEGIRNPAEEALGEEV